jgi:hypothetical protein
MNFTNKGLDPKSASPSVATGNSGMSCACGPACKCGPSCKCEPGATCTSDCKCGT